MIKQSLLYKPIQFQFQPENPSSQPEMSPKSILSTTSRILILRLIFFTLNSKAQENTNPTSSSCPSSSCGTITNISYPFRLRGDPTSCGYNNPVYVLDCLNNQTILRSGNRNFHVQEIDYEYYSIRLVDPNINGSDLSSCSVYPNGYDDWAWDTRLDKFLDWNIPVYFIHCLNPSSRYVRASFCGNRTDVVSNSSYSYVMVGDSFDTVSDLEDSCTVDRVDRASARRPWRDNSSLANIYEHLGYGFELSWFRVHCGECERTYGFCSVDGSAISCKHYCREDVPISEQSFSCQTEYWGLIIGAYAVLVIAGILGLRLLFGIPFLLGLVIYKWRRRHLSVDESNKPKDGNESV